MFSALLFFHPYPNEENQQRIFFFFLVLKLLASTFSLPIVSVAEPGSKRCDVKL
jgi:hypothetical protein